jgi:hypothetical protein
MAQLAVQRSGGLNIKQITTQAAAGGGDAMPNDGQTLFQVTAGATGVTVTAVSVACSHGRTKDISFIIPTNQTHLIGPFDPTLFNDANGNVNFTYSQVTTITVAAVRANN